ncbi:kinesin-domain-containing protein [Ascobolus immersus RN42]|uniref:Kinesin-like protein n=1 Tax=Ascobolus immersus RN42 TaxID=1160509 RepID=A0A3N4HYY7_ASCIM|nr:kinesin-domain-containing protein [Ascobolus immersus RN42]
MSNSIKVVARFRPQNKIEIREGGSPIVRFPSEETCVLDSENAQGSFTFDRIFDMNSKQRDVFDYSIKSTVDDILLGYNGTVFAYGQTGAGKSYTMMGGDIDDEESRGIIPRIVQQIFESILSSPGNIEYTVRVSYMEIYMERVRDLLNPVNDNLPIHEDKSRGVYVKGLLEIYVSSVEEVYEVMRRGGTARAVSATNMNAESSRSHSIFVVSISQKNVETGSAKTGTLYLVDLAGSEKVGKTGASGQTLEEAKKINKSLSALGMVINALTDGKSAYVPYRDSKLTRILQESLGGNSRTTLIINCSPSSYNDSETMGTLRFGMRAKSIKNKAKVNAELSPAELKAVLKSKEKTIVTYTDYIGQLHGELIVWRQGEPVPREKWVQFMPGLEGKSEAPKTRPETPSNRQIDAIAASPSRPDSRIDLRSSTPTALDKDEKEDFLRRENEFQDQLAEKESQLAASEKALKELREELNLIKEHDSKIVKENEKMATEVNELKMQLEKLSFEGKEAQITMDGLKEANAELTSELDEVKQHLLEVKMAAKENSSLTDEKEKKKAERMAKMMAGFDLGSDVFSDNERKIRELIEQFDQLTAGDLIPQKEASEVRAKLLETQGIVRQAELSLNERSAEQEQASRRREELENKLMALETEYEELLSKNIGAQDAEALKEKLEQAYISKKDTEVEMVHDLKIEISKKNEENEKLKTQLEDLNRRLRAGGDVSLQNGKTVAQQIAEFDVMKKSLMRDLQNRCERVVELELSLDETREQYNNVLRSSNNRAQQKKMAFLERNLEQLTLVQRQLVEQNGQLKKEVAIAERKLNARNERIQSLESLLQDSQDKLTSANHRFEAQLTAVKERLEAAKIGTRNVAQPSNFSFGGSRIAKPLRGGGGNADMNGIAGNRPIVLSGAQNSAAAQESQQSKRTSWFSR